MGLDWLMQVMQLKRGGNKSIKTSTGLVIGRYAEDTVQGCMQLHWESRLKQMTRDYYVWLRLDVHLVSISCIICIASLVLDQYIQSRYTQDIHSSPVKYTQDVDSISIKHGIQRLHCYSVGLTSSSDSR